MDQLQGAGQYEFDSYKALQAETAGSRGAFEAHHLIEKRFVKVMSKIWGENTSEWPSIVLTKAEHRVFTNAWRKAIPYGEGTLNATRAEVEAAARKIYADHPEILKELRLN